ncbi:MAG: alpha/beta hydrolase [Limnohabitans sp.]|uniref:alpha/beta fold hydrolase n=1 Tax=Limnohabitans sp. TaxID=1907725 RepID=UPI001B68E5B0|nr:alpha/beta hydrolase [Limnohabitans sp.]MBP6220428.1 alpha/beta hydrolase [Limnohabitans sp.]MBP6245441.1 alpha/beta hydrolase [Limnohabitans sp.]
MYQVQRESQSLWVPLRGCRYHVRQWGTPTPGATPLVLAHGWMDVAASWQFMVDAFSQAFAQQRPIIAMDWRGYGLTEAPPTDSYWFPDYLADLDALLDQLYPGQTIDLVGHSMGGNVVMMYAGTRPERIRRLVNLEGFGMPATRPAQAPGRMGQWLDELKALRDGASDLKPYANAAGVAARLMKTNRRLGADKANWLAQHWAKPGSDGQWRILGDAAHKVINPYLFHVEEALEIYRRITAPVLAVEAADDSLGQWWKGQYTLAEFHERLKSVPTLETAVIQDAGHMLHHDQPQTLAALLQKFLA